MYTGERTQRHSNNLHASQGRQAAASSAHSVHFYEDDSLFLDSLSEFVGAALGAGGACVVAATNAHRAGLEERLKTHGIDLGFAINTNQFISLDASELLRHVMVNGHPDGSRFNAAIEPELERAGKALRRNSTSVVAFGEMVAMLWQEGQQEAAIELEKLWRSLAERHAVSLRSAYPIGLFADQSQFDSFCQVYAVRHQVIPSESYTALDNDDDRYRMISSLQQRAWTMQAMMKDREEEIARLKRVEARLQRSEQFAKSIVENSADCVKVLNLDGCLDYMSPQGVRALEMEDVREVLGRGWVDFWKAEDRLHAEAALTSARNGGVGTFIGESLTARGTRKWWDVRITPSLDADGKVERLIAISRDITDVRIAQQAAIESERQATAGRMAATIAHEINNPLEAVTNFIFLALTTEGMPEEAARHLQVADRELARAAQITRQMLGFYRGGSKRRWIPFSEVIQDVLTIYGRKLRNKQLSTSISVDPGLEIYGKDGELRQVLLNLTANAVDASLPGGTLWFRAHRTPNWKGGSDDGLRITLADNGSGMSPEVQRRIFVPFFTTKIGTGTGLGLWVTKCLIEQQGGYVHFRSRQGKRSGTVMSLFLPVARKVAGEIAEVA